MRTGERSINNAVFNLLSVLLPGAAILLLLPYIEHTLGADGYGIYTLVGTVMGYFVVLDLGLASAVTKYTAEYNVQNDMEGMRSLVSTSMLLLLVIGTAGALMMAGCAKLLATRLLHIPAASRETAFLAFCAGGVGFLFSMQFTLFTGVLNGLNRYDLSGSVTTGIGLLTPIGTIILLYLGIRLLGVVLLNVGITLAAAIISAAMIRKVLPLVPLRPAFDRRQLGRIFGFGIFTLLSRVSDLIVHQVDVVIIGVMLDVSWVTYYIIPLRMVMVFSGITVRIANVGFPVISEFHGRNDMEGATRFYAVLSRIILVVATSFSLPAIILGHQVLRFWMGAAFAEKSGATLGLLAAGVYLAMPTKMCPLSSSTA